MVGAAAGNLFIGTYKTNVGKPESSPSFGRAYSGARPTKLSGYYKYKSMGNGKISQKNRPQILRKADGKF